jgi:hypothetical protein
MFKLVAAVTVTVLVLSQPAPRSTAAMASIAFAASAASAAHALDLMRYSIMMSLVALAAGILWQTLKIMCVSHGLDLPFVFTRYI